MSTTRREALPRHGILVATELGLPGATAIAHGASWAQRFGCPLVVAHVVGTGDAIAPLLPHLAETLPDETQLRRAAEAVQTHAGQHTGPLGEDFDVALELGGAEERIVALSERLAPRLLVIGASRKGAIEHALLGSTAEAILRHAACPVIVARGDVTAGPVLVATDFVDESLTAERTAADLARAGNAELVLVHGLDVFRPLAATFEPSTMIDPGTLESLRSSAEEMARSALERVGARGTCLVEAGDPSRIVVEAAQRLGASLIVVSSHGREGIARLMHGSAAERIVRAATCSVLVTHRPPD